MESLQTNKQNTLKGDKTYITASAHPYMTDAVVYTALLKKVTSGKSFLVAKGNYKRFSLSVHLSIHLFVCPSIHPSVRPSVRSIPVYPKRERYAKVTVPLTFHVLLIDL